VETAIEPLDRRSSSMRAAIEQQSIISPTISHGPHGQPETALQERRSEEAVVDRNERAAERSFARHMSPEPPERLLGTVRSPTEDPADPSSNYTLPVVEEAASESGSIASRGADADGANNANGRLKQSVASSKFREPKAPERPPPPTPPEEP